MRTDETAYPARPQIEAEWSHLFGRRLAFAADQIGFRALAGLALAPFVEDVDRHHRNEQAAALDDDLAPLWSAA